MRYSRLRASTVLSKNRTWCLDRFRLWTAAGVLRNTTRYASVGCASSCLSACRLFYSLFTTTFNILVSNMNCKRCGIVVPPWYFRSVNGVPLCVRDEGVAMCCHREGAWARLWLCCWTSSTCDVLEGGHPCPPPRSFFFLSFISFFKPLLVVFFHRCLILVWDFFFFLIAATFSFPSLDKSSCFETCTSVWVLHVLKNGGPAGGRCFGPMYFWFVTVKCWSFCNLRTKNV